MSPKALKKLQDCRNFTDLHLRIECIFFSVPTLISRIHPSSSTSPAPPNIQQSEIDISLQLDHKWNIYPFWHQIVM